MRTLGEAKANVALARSLFEVVYVVLKEHRPYQEPDPEQMHELEKAKFVRDHAKHLRQLGADNELVEEVVARLERHVFSSVAFSWAYCAALEAITQTTCPRRASNLRALALEHERIANHLGDLGALGNDAGFAFGLTQFLSLKEELLRTNAAVFGAR